MIKLLIFNLGVQASPSVIPLLVAQGFASRGLAVALACIGRAAEASPSASMENWQLPVDDPLLLEERCRSMSGSTADILIVDAPAEAVDHSGLRSSCSISLAPVPWSLSHFRNASAILTSLPGHTWMIPIGIPGGSAASVVSGMPPGCTPWPYVLPFWLSPMSRVEEASVLAQAPLPRPRRNGAALAEAIELVLSGRQVPSFSFKPSRPPAAGAHSRGVPCTVIRPPAPRKTQPSRYN